MALPAFNEDGDLPPGVHPATLLEVLERFGQGTTQRQAVASRLMHIYELANSTGHLARFVVFGSFVTAKNEPTDVDIGLLMEDTFDLESVAGETALVFQHQEANVHFGASNFLDATYRGVRWGTGHDRILAGSPRRRPTAYRGACEGATMIANDQQLEVTLERIAWFHKQVARLRKAETNPTNYRATVSGFLAEIDRMQLEIREYFSSLPAEGARAV